MLNLKKVLDKHLGPCYTIRMKVEINHEVAQVENPMIDVAVKVRVEQNDKFNMYFDKLNRIATKLGLPKFEINFLYKLTKYNIDRAYRGRVKEIRYNVYQVSGQSPVLNGWSLVGKIEFEDHLNHPIIKDVPGLQIPNQFFNTDCHCDHCNINRFRKSVFVVQSETEGYKQIGSACMHDFLGHGSVEDIIKLYAYLDELASYGSEETDSYREGHSGTELYCADTVLASMIRVIKRYGYVSNKRASEEFKTATTSVWSSFESLNHLGDVERGYNLNKMDEVDISFYNDTFNQEISDEEKRQIEEIRNFYGTKEVVSSFDQNTKTLSQSKYFSHRDLGYVAAMVGLHLVKSFQKKEVAINQSEWVGSIASRITLTINLTKVMPVSSEWGVSFLHCGTDEKGNQIVFFNAKEFGEIDDTVKIIGTVKSHGTFNNTKQTTLNRVKKI